MILKQYREGHGGTVGNAITSQLLSPRFDSQVGDAVGILVHKWGVFSPPLYQHPHPFLCGICMFSLVS